MTNDELIAAYEDTQAQYRSAQQEQDRLHEELNRLSTEMYRRGLKNINNMRTIE